MKFLKNSSRSLYKATFDVNTKNYQLPATMEKLAYVKSLNIQSREMDNFFKLPGLSNLEKKLLEKTIDVIKPIVTSESYTLTLQLAATLGDITVDSLVLFGKHLVKIRKSREESLAASKSGVNKTDKYVPSVQVEDMANLFLMKMQKHRYGWLHLERIDMKPTNELVEGELIYSLPLAPDEKLTMFHKEWSSQSKELERVVSEVLETSEENTIEDKRDASMSTETQSQISTAFSASAGYSGLIGLSFSTNFSRNTNDSISEKRSQQQTQTLTKKSAAKARKELKTTFKINSSSGIEDSTERILENKSSDSILQLDYYKQLRKWKVNLIRTGMRLSYDMVIPNPSKHIVDRYINLRKVEETLSQQFSFGIRLRDIEPYNDSSNSFYLNLANEFGVQLPAPPQEKIETKNNVFHGGADNADITPGGINYQVPEGYSIRKMAIQFDLLIGSGDVRNSNIVFSNTTFNNRFGVRDARLRSGSAGNGIIRFFYPREISYEEEYFTTRIVKGTFSLDFTWQLFDGITANVIAYCKPDGHILDQWRMDVWQKLYDAAKNKFDENKSNMEERRARILEEIDSDDPLILRQREREEIMKRVLNSFFEYDFSVIENISELPQCELRETIIPGELISFLNQAIEWEYLTYVLYPYFWSDVYNRSYKMFLEHPDRIHRDFLRAGAARVLIPIRRGWENAFVNAVEVNPLAGLTTPPPPMPIAKEFQIEAWKRYNDMPPDGANEEFLPDEKLDELIKPFATWFEYMPTSGMKVKATKIKAKVE